MTQRHHYSVTTRSAGGEEEKWLHTFAEAEAEYQRRVESARGEETNVSSGGYWRTTVTAPGGAVTEVRIDDAGLRTCGLLCGGG